MTEKEKMLAGQLYFPGDDELYAERTRCKDLCFDFNNTRPSNEDRLTELLSRIVGKMGEDAFITPPFNCDYGYNITLGKNFYANHNLVILDCAEVTFGDNVMIAPNCCFSAAKHPLDAKTRNKWLEDSLPIKVGNNVWIGANVTVLPGVTIGDNTVIGAGSTVTRDIPSGVVAFGSPCRAVRKIEQADGH